MISYKTHNVWSIKLTQTSSMVCSVIRMPFCSLVSSPRSTSAPHTNCTGWYEQICKSRFTKACNTKSIFISSATMNQNLIKHTFRMLRKSVSKYQHNSLSHTCYIHYAYCSTILASKSLKSKKWNLESNLSRQQVASIKDYPTALMWTELNLDNNLSTLSPTLTLLSTTSFLRLLNKRLRNMACFAVVFSSGSNNFLYRAT